MTVITYLLFLSLSFFTIYAVGYVISVLFKLNNASDFYHTVFRNTCVGMIVSVSLYALLITTGKSIFSGLIILCLYYLIVHRKRDTPLMNWNFQNKLAFNEIFFISFPLFIFFGWKLSYVFGLNFSFPNVINGDDLCHVQRAMFLNQFGIETTDLNYVQLPNGVQPFHYFESWQIAFFQGLTQSNYWLTEQLLVVPLTASIMFYGVVTITKKLALSKFTSILSILVVFGGAFYLPSFIDISFLKWTGAFNSTPFTEYWSMKYGILYIIVIHFILLYITERKKMAILSLLVLPLFSITLAPSFLTAIFLILAYHKFKKTFSISWFEIFLPIIIGVFILLFYALFKSTTVFIEIPGLRSTIGEFFIPNNIKRNVILMAEKVIHVLIFYSPYIFIYFYLKRNTIMNDATRNLHQSFGMLLFITLVSLPMWPLFYGTFGSSEFFNYPSIAIFNIIGIILLLTFIGTRKSLFAYALSSIIGLFFIYKTITTNKNFQLESARLMYSSQYLEEIYSLREVFSGVSGGIIDDFDEFETGHHYNSFGFYVYGYSQIPVYNISLTRHAQKIPEEITKQRELFAITSPFYRYVETLKTANDSIIINDAQLKFVMENKLKYLIICPKSQIPEKLKPLVTKTVIDHKSKERFVLLKN